MTRVVGIDPGTLSIDLCGIVDGQLYLDRSWPTAEALSEPAGLVEILTTSGPPDLIVGPSGYGLPLRRAVEATETDLRLAFLAPPGETGGIGGLRGLARALAASGLPVVYVPAVIHLDTVPAHRKLNRVDLGTADKLSAAALGIWDQGERRRRNPEQVSFILIELGGAFTAGVAVERGQVVDGVTSFLERAPALRSVALEAYVEGATKAARQLRCSAPSADEILLSGRDPRGPPSSRTGLPAALIVSWSIG